MDTCTIEAERPGLADKETGQEIIGTQEVGCWMGRNQI